MTKRITRRDYIEQSTATRASETIKTLAMKKGDMLEIFRRGVTIFEYTCPQDGEIVVNFEAYLEKT